MYRQCNVHCINCTVYILFVYSVHINKCVQCTLYMHIVQCTLYNVHMKFYFRETTVSEVKKYKFLNVSASASRCNIFVSSLQEQVYQHFMESKNSSYLLKFMRLDLVFAGTIMATKLENKS